MDNKLCFPSVDTITLSFPVSLADMSRFKVKSLHQYFGDIDKAKAIVFLTPEDHDKISSGQGYLTASYDGVELTVQVSVPKMLYGHSATMTSDVEGACSRIAEYLEFMGVTVPNFFTWRVKRLDFCYNFYFQAASDVVNVLDALSRLRYRGKVGYRTRAGKPLPYWPGQDRTLKFYSKGLEMSRDLALWDCFSDDEHERLLRILRFEEELRGEALKKVFDCSTSEMLTVNHVCAKLFRFDMHEYIVSRLDYFTGRTPRASLNDYMTQLNAAGLSPTSTYACTVERIMEVGWDQYRAETAPATYKRHMAKLRRVGIEPAYLDTHYDRYHQVFTRLQDVVDVDQIPFYFMDRVVCPDREFDRIIQNCYYG